MRTEIAENPYQEFKERFFEEEKYISQTSEWKSGMRYNYSPDNYPISREQLTQLEIIGPVIGELLEKSFPKDTFVEFRIDFVNNRPDNRFYVTEIQTDDRGLPAMANVRNVRSTTGQEKFPGVTKALASSLKDLSGKAVSSLLIVFPEEESFYYSNMADFAQLLAAEGIETIPVSDNLIANGNKGEIRVRVPYDNIYFAIKPDFIWNFSTKTLQGSNAIQPAVDKALMIDQINMEFIPKTIPINKNTKRGLLVCKDDWVIKPISGRWSKGVLFGNTMSSKEWETEVEKNSGTAIAQQFIPPKKERFYVRGKNGDFTLKSLFARVEGYYVKNQKTDAWEIADVMATCTEKLPVHGKRDCIMIPGEVVNQI